VSEIDRCRAFKYVLKPTAKQEHALTRLLGVQCDLYNAALQERKGAWKWNNRSVTKFEQFGELTGFDWDGSEFGNRVARGTLTRLDLAFQAFFRRCHTGVTPGFPRFKAKQRFDSVDYSDIGGWKLDTEASRLVIQGIGHVKVRIHRSIKGVPKTLTVCREGRRWYAVVSCVDVPAEPQSATGNLVGVDRGVTVAAALSDGVLIDNDRFGKRSATRLAVEQQALARCKRGSKRRKSKVQRVAAAHRKVRNQRADATHQLSRRLVDDFDVIVFEDLKIKNMTRRPKSKPAGDGTFLPNGAAQKSCLNKAILDVGWGDLLRKTIYKAESAGREIILINPRNTSRTCYECGTVDPDSRSGTVFRCVACGHQDHADTNAAKNILRLGLSQRASAESGATA